MVFTITELFDLAFMTVLLGVIFMNFFKGFSKPKAYDPLTHYNRGFNFDWNSFKFSVIVVAPAIVLHELAHKFVAIGYGLQATFHAAYFWLFLGLVLSLMNFKFIFFIPGYVAITGAAGPLQYSLTAGAGPFMNLLLWIVAFTILKYKLMNKKYYPILYLTKQINMFLFIFNMIPLSIFDGAKFFSGLFQYISTAL